MTAKHPARTKATKALLSPGAMPAATSTPADASVTLKLTFAGVSA